MDRENDGGGSDVSERDTTGELPPGIAFEEAPLASLLGEMSDDAIRARITQLRAIRDSAQTRRAVLVAEAMDENVEDVKPRRTKAQPKVDTALDDFMKLLEDDI